MVNCAGCVDVGPRTPQCRARTEAAVAAEEAAHGAAPEVPGDGAAAATAEPMAEGAPPPVAADGAAPPAPDPATQAPGSAASAPMEVPRSAAVQLPMRAPRRSADSPTEGSPPAARRRLGDEQAAPLLAAGAAQSRGFLVPAPGSTAGPQESEQQISIGELATVGGNDLEALYLKPDGVEEYAVGHGDEEETIEAERVREEFVVLALGYEDPASARHIEAYDVRTKEKLDPEKVRKGRPKEVKELRDFEDEAEMRITPGKKIWSKWVKTRKDPSKAEVRSRLCATEVNVGDRSDCFVAAPPLKFVRLVMSWAATHKPKRSANKGRQMILMISDVSVAFFHGNVRLVLYVVPPRDLRELHTIWRLQKLYGTRDASHVFSEYIARAW